MRRYGAMAVAVSALSPELKRELGIKEKNLRPRTIELNIDELTIEQMLQLLDIDDLLLGEYINELNTRLSELDQPRLKGI